MEHVISSYELREVLEMISLRNPPWSHWCDSSIKSNCRLSSSFLISVLCFFWGFQHNLLHAISLWICLRDFRLKISKVKHYSLHSFQQMSFFHSFLLNDCIRPIALARVLWFISGSSVPAPQPLNNVTPKCPDSSSHLWNCHLSSSKYPFLPLLLQ
jgi:hypothetical protein